MRKLKKGKGKYKIKVRGIKEAKAFIGPKLNV